ncbi:MAG: hypothetical protein K2X81_12715, partial [Candidatus Obscuribacterales bacterium]|nr:hypothetical protein [Candidatus Obscuribacterales bacterium]
MNLVLWQRILLTLAVASLVFATMQSQNCAAVRPESKKKAETPLSKPSTPAPKTIKATIEVGPFDLHRKYRSMEGPYVAELIRISDLLATAAVKVPESRVIFVEGGSSAPSMNGAAMGNNGSIAGLVDTSSSDKELYWFKSIKLQVLDENNHPLPSAEFICHLNIDADQVNRFMSFPDLERTGSSRVITITQGQTEFHFPDGYAVPVSSDEEWKFIFQAANRTTNQHRRVKHLCTVEFIKDSDLKSDMKALHWYNPYISVLLDESNAPPEHHGPGCMAISSGGNAPNMVPNTNFKDDKGRDMSSHWSIPPGRHVYRMPITEYSDPGFNAEDRKIHAVWTHIHPFCTNTTLAVCNGDLE